MTWLVILARTLAGLVFLVFGLEYFFHFLNMPRPEIPPAAVQFTGAMAASGYFDAVKVLEILGAVNLLTGRYAPLGIAMLLPISLNILFFEIFLTKAPGIGVVMVGLLLFVLFGYRSTVRPVFDGTARIG